MPPPVDATSLRSRVQEVLDADVERQRGVLAELGEPMNDLVDAVARLLQGGKRLRAAFAYWGYRALGGADSLELVRMASSMEYFQAAALLHDDVMDDSDLRRGQPTAHRQLATRHTERGWIGDPDRFGQAGAILAGNLCLTWCDELYAGSGLPDSELARARETFDTMRTQLMGGQYLDVLEAAVGWEQCSHRERVDRCLRVIRYKSAKYSVEQPLLIGARAAGADARTCRGLSAYGLALGEAFQLRDDVLGVFGDPEETGKPAGDDLREGKRTVLIAHALERAAPRDRTVLLDALANPDLDDAAITACRQILSDCGAVEATEAMITGGSSRARAALAGVEGLTTQGRQALEDLVASSTTRTT